MEKSGRERGVLDVVAAFEASSETAALVLLKRTWMPTIDLDVEGRGIEATRGTARKKSLEAIIIESGMGRREKSAVRWVLWE